MLFVIMSGSCPAAAHTWDFLFIVVPANIHWFKGYVKILFDMLQHFVLLLKAYADPPPGYGDVHMILVRIVRDLIALAILRCCLARVRYSRLRNRIKQK